MINIIRWCNENSGFIDAIVAIISSLLSFMAIIISIHTARLPFKKAIKLTLFYDIRCKKNDLSPNIESGFVGFTINAANVGFRNINLVFLGLAQRQTKIGKFIKMEKITIDNYSKGILEPTNICSVQYDFASLAANLDRLDPKFNIYVFALDSEGKEYYKFIGKKAIVEENIRKNL